MAAIQLSSLPLASASITGPIWVAGSRGSPIFSSRMAPISMASIGSATSCCRQSSRSAEQRWPAERKADAITSSITCSGSAVASTIMALMPPVSPISGTIGPLFCASARLIAWPTSVEPVKATPATSRSATRKAPTLPSPGTRWSAAHRHAGFMQERDGARGDRAASARPAWRRPCCRRRARRSPGRGRSPAENSMG